MAIRATYTAYAYISGAWVELLDTMPVSAFWGMGDNKPGTRLADVGELRLSLNNQSGIYTPGGPSGLAGWKKGIPFKIEFSYEELTKIRFRGFIEDIDLSTNVRDKKVHITVSDWLGYAAKYPIVNPALLQDSTADDAITEILSNTPIDPQVLSIDTGKSVFPTLFDTVTGHTTGYSEFAKLALSEPGYIYTRHDGTAGETLVFESLDYRNGTRALTSIPLGEGAGVLLLEDGDELLLEDGDNLLLNETGTPTFATFISKDVTYGENIVNRFTINAHPKRTDTASLKVYETEKPVYLASGETKTFRVFWRDPDGKRPINAVPPSSNTTTVSLVHFDSQDGNFFPDETGKVWEGDLNDVVAYPFSVFGDAAAYFDGSNSYITSSDSPDWDFGAGDFTFEWWEYRYVTTSGITSFSRDGTAGTPSYKFGRSNGSNMQVDITSSGTAWDIANGKSLGSIAINTWTHYAVTRSGSNFYTFRDGIAQASWTSSATILAATTPLYAGRNQSSYFGGNIDELRISKGTALYTADFTVPTEPFYLDGTYYSFWTANNETGTDLRESLTVSADYGTEGATYTVTNSSTLGGYLIIRTYAKGIYSDSPLQAEAEDTDSINTYGYQNDGMTQAYQQDTYNAEIEAARVVDFEKQPRTVLNKVSMCANVSDQLMNAFLYVDVGDLVRITITSHGVDGWYYIQGVEFEVRNGLTFFSWNVKRAWTLANGLSPVAVEFNGGTDSINYGYIPQVYSDVGLVLL
jgi:hypothetical protein